MTYQEQLKDERWITKRKIVLERDHYSCRWCEETRLPLHVHHKEYRAGLMAWEYSRFDLITLCERCHSHYHAHGSFPPKEQIIRQVKRIGMVMSDFVNSISDNVTNKKRG